MPSGVVLEFQSVVDWMMAARVQDYATQIWLDMRRRRPFRSGRAPPPILPVVLYNGEPNWNAPTRLADMWRLAPPSVVRDGSDVDVALPDRAPLDMGAVVNIAGAVGDDLGRDVDVVNLHHVPVPIAGIALEGIRLFGSDECYANLCSRALFEYESFGRLRAQLLDQRIDAWIRQ